MLNTFKMKLNMQKVITDYSEIAKLATLYRQSGQKIVLTQGSFDMIHIGHCRYLAKAKTYGDVLFVGIDSDEKIKKRKGPERPVVPEDERTEMLTYLSSVDHVVIKPLAAPKWQLIKLIKPDVLIAVENTYSNQEIEALEKFCGQVVVLKRQATTSTSAKLRRLQIGFAQNFSHTLTTKIHQSIDEVLEQLKK